MCRLSCRLLSSSLLGSWLLYSSFLGSSGLLHDKWFAELEWSTCTSSLHLVQATDTVIFISSMFEGQQATWQRQKRATSRRCGKVSATTSLCSVGVSSSEQSVCETKSVISIRGRRSPARTPPERQVLWGQVRRHLTPKQAKAQGNNWSFSSSKNITRTRQTTLWAVCLLPFSTGSKSWTTYVSLRLCQMDRLVEKGPKGKQDLQAVDKTQLPKITNSSTPKERSTSDYYYSLPILHSVTRAVSCSRTSQPSRHFRGIVNIFRYVVAYLFTYIMVSVPEMLQSYM